MSEVVIKVENVSKQYRLGSVGTGTLSHDLNRMWARVRGKEDPYAKIGETNDRTTKGNSDFVWSLKDINFEVKHGEVLGIIGRNGAGKSTLLKILSRTTSPTTGNIKIKGRVASLLEVGTGFHPELTGRENIYLNGAILGMSKSEISRKFDEIVDFSGVERYIDTPVKRYSSGMYVRLAFAVAANLEPEILIVDEVLAVGDAEFQKKCLGKMKDVSVNEGRTVLFVSHNLAAIKTLCTKLVVLNNGKVVFSGGTDEGLKRYIEDVDSATASHYIKQTINNKSSFLEIKVENQLRELVDSLEFNEDIFIAARFQLNPEHFAAKIGFRVIDNQDRIVFTNERNVKDFITKPGIGNFRVKIPARLIVPNRYKIMLVLHIPNVEFIELLNDVVSFEILETGSELQQYQNTDYGCVFVDCEWDTIK
jgi:lipopolysaccharide transport system ATP-binding protein